MSLRRVMLLGALASSFLLAAGTSSQAAYSYSTAISITAVSISGATTNSASGASFAATGGLGATVTFTNINSAPLIGSNTVNIGDLAVTTSNPTPQTFNVSYTDVVTITNPTPGGPTGTFTINGVLSLAGVQSLGGSAGTYNNLYSGTLSQTKIIDANSFLVSFGNGIQNDFFGPPTTNGASGSIGANISISAIPEPASLALMGTGLVAVLGLGLRRMKRPDLKRS